MPVSHAYVYIHIYFIFVFIHMKSKRYIDGSGENLSHIPALSLLDESPFLMGLFHFLPKAQLPLNPQLLP